MVPIWADVGVAGSGFEVEAGVFFIGRIGRIGRIGLMGRMRGFGLVGPPAEAFGIVGVAPDLVHR